MTKIKNTKKGMAKKTLSMSLVVAMLATSNVPVWAAEFSDGSDTAVATEAPAAEAFSDEADATPVVDATADVNAANDATVSGNEYSVTYTPIGFLATGSSSGTQPTPIADNTMTWADGTLSTTVSVTDNKILTGAKVYATWKVDNVAVGGLATTTEGTFSNDIATITPTPYTVSSATANKTVSLYVYAVKDNQVVWSYTSDAITVNPKNTADVVKATATDVEYNGKIQQATPTLNPVSGSLPAELDGTDDYTIGYDENSDFVNVTDKPITITLTPKSSAYKGSITTTYKINPKNLSTSNAIADEMVATLKNTSYKFDGGNTNTDVLKVKKEDITLVDKATKKIDLSDYLKVDKNGYVNVTRDGKIELATPETGNKNYTISGTAGTDDTKIQSTNVPEVAARDLSSVTVTIDPVQKTNNKATLAADQVHFYDKDSKKELALFNYVDIDIPNNAVEAGKYTVTITPKATTSSSSLQVKLPLNYQFLQQISILLYSK